MAIQVITRVTNVRIENVDKKELTSCHLLKPDDHIIKPDHGKDDTGGCLKLYTSLIGENEPELSDDQYGPMLQGSLILTFHGSPVKGKKLRLYIRPCMNFYEKSDMSFVNPYESLNIDHYIEINPLSRQ